MKNRRYLPTEFRLLSNYHCNEQYSSQNRNTVANNTICYTFCKCSSGSDEHHWDQPCDTYYQPYYSSRCLLHKICSGSEKAANDGGSQILRNPKTKGSKQEHNSCPCNKKRPHHAQHTTCIFLNRREYNVSAYQINNNHHRKLPPKMFFNYSC